MTTQGHPQDAESQEKRSSEHGLQQRPYLRVLFDCCSIYQRIYRDLNGKSYTGRCPRCLRSIRFLIGANGTANRDFTVF